MNSLKAWPSQAYLDALRPEVGWAVETAILASYSADLASIATALLALSGRDDDHGSGGKTDLAEAIEELRGKVRITIQRGRLAKLKRLPTIAGILDQFVVDVPFDEAVRSWHPKLALISFSHPKAGSACRLWLGSRNLTKVENLDLGFVLNGVAGRNPKGQAIDGLEELVKRLTEQAGLSSGSRAAFARQVSQMQWKVPVGLKVKSIRLTSGLGDEVLPPCPARLQEVVIVSPFLTSGFVGTIGGWGTSETRRTVLSSHSELRKLALQTGRPLKGYTDRILAFNAPLPEGIEPEPIEPEPIEAGHLPREVPIEAGAEEVPSLGLHAKILAARSSGKLRIWIGSANATERAWTGRNVEVIAALEADNALYAGLEHLLEQGRPLTETELVEDQTDSEDPIRDRLDEARVRVSAKWVGRILRDGDVFRLLSDQPPHPHDPDIRLEAGLATDTLHAWPRNSITLEFGQVPLSLQTELVQFRLSLGNQECSWLQRCTVTPPIDEGRDRAALARHLGPRAFLDWIRTLLGDGTRVNEIDEPWDRETRKGTGVTTNLSALIDALTLEDMLSCWARDPKAFARADRRMRDFLEPVIAESNDIEIEDLNRLRAIRQIWDTLSGQLIGQP